MENKRLFGRICCLQRYMSRENNLLFAEYGITPVQMDTLVFILLQNKDGKNVCQRDIEKRVNMRASSVSALIATLEKKGLITRAFAEGDARTKYVALTENGKIICKKNKMLMERCDEAVQSALTEDEQEIFIKLLNKIMDKAEVCGKEAAK